MSLYEDMKEAGCQIDNHYSDLHVKATIEALQVLLNYPDATFTYFTSDIDGDTWYDFPFMYLPYWEEKTK